MVVVIRYRRAFIFPVLTRMYEGAQDSVERRASCLRSERSQAQVDGRPGRSIAVRHLGPFLQRSHAGSHHRHELPCVPGDTCHRAGAEANPTVRILFGGEEAFEVQTESTTKVWCPDATGNPGLVNVTVTNIDQDGVAVAGETATKTNAFTYIRPYIRVPSGATSVDAYRSDRSVS